MCTTRAPIVARCARRRGGEPAHERAAELALTRPPATIESRSARGPRRRVVLGGARPSAVRGARGGGGAAPPGRAPLRAALGTGAVLCGAVRCLRRATLGRSGPRWAQW